jgi:hypothetical protein
MKMFEVKIVLGIALSIVTGLIVLWFVTNVVTAPAR